MRFYRTLSNQETGLWPLQIKSKHTLFYVPWTVKDRTHGPALTHWGRVTHICVSKLTTIGSDNGLSPGRRQAIIWRNTGILLNWTLGTNFSEILSKIDTFSFKQMRLKMSSGKWQPYCLGLNVLRSGFAIVATGWRKWCTGLRNLYPTRPVSDPHFCLRRWRAALGPLMLTVPIGLSTHSGTGVDGAGGRRWKLADFLLKHV